MPNVELRFWAPASTASIDSPFHTGDAKSSSAEQTSQALEQMTGEHGKGFAVVAVEVRKLAERSQTAAEEISQLARSSVGLAEKAGTLLETIVPSVSRTAGLVQEISAATVEQSAGVSQSNAALAQVASGVQQNAAAAEELSATWLPGAARCGRGGGWSTWLVAFLRCHWSRTTPLSLKKDTARWRVCARSLTSLELLHKPVDARGFVAL